MQCKIPLLAGFVMVTLYLMHEISVWVALVFGKKKVSALGLNSGL